MSKFKIILNKIKLSKIKINPTGKKTLIVDRQRIFSVMKNYSAIKILEKKNLLDVHILTDLKSNSNISIFYKFLGFEKIVNSFRFK